MQSPILATKLFQPRPRANLIPRARLNTRLDKALEGRLTLISAPAGFGKTALLSTWLATVPRPVAWLSLDADDSDLSRFLRHLLASLAQHEPRLQEIQTWLQSPQTPPLKPLLTNVINLLTQSKPMILVLDDLHLLESQAVAQALLFLAEHLPPQFHLILSTREDPALPLARWRVRQQLSEIRVADLRFTPPEAATFLQESMHLHLSAPQIEALETRTEGWIAGLQLAALSLQGQSDISQFIQSFTGSHRFVMDYLVAEVLQQRSPKTQAFLLQTSILQRLHGPLCDAVLQWEKGSGASTLTQLEAANLLLVPLDQARQWYRYHHLFGEVLQAHLQQSSPELIPTLHQRASGWYAKQAHTSHEFTRAAIHHALLAQDPSLLAPLLERIWPEMDALFQTDLWLQWAETLPEALRQSRPLISGNCGWAYLSQGKMAAAQEALQTAETLLEQDSGAHEDPLQLAALPASLATARAYLAQMQGDLEASRQQAQKALAALPPHHQAQRSMIQAILGLAHWHQGDLETAYQTLSESMAAFRQAGQLNFALSGTFGLADIRCAQGRLHAARQLYAEALEIAQAHTPMPPGSADLYLGLGKLAHLQGNGSEAQAYLQKSTQEGERNGLPDWAYRQAIAELCFHLTQRDWAAASRALQKAKAHYSPTPLPDLSPLDALEVRVWIGQGRWQEALDWAQKKDLQPEREVPFGQQFECLTLARLYLSRLEAEEPALPASELERFLKVLVQSLMEGGYLQNGMEALLLHARFWHLQQEEAKALAALDQALKLAAPQSYCALFWELGSDVQALCQRWLDAHPKRPERDFVKRLLQGPGSAAALPQKPLTPTQPLIEPLSERELEILALIEAGLSNQEISERLFLALSTVKGHNRNLFGKLGVKRRTEAVAQARQLGLI